MYTTSGSQFSGPLVWGGGVERHVFLVPSFAIALGYRRSPFQHQLPLQQPTHLHQPRRRKGEGVTSAANGATWHGLVGRPNPIHHKAKAKERDSGLHHNNGPNHRKHGRTPKAKVATP
eukprot:EG_transcript_36179